MDSGKLPRVVVVSDFPPVTEGVGVASSIVLERLFSAYPEERITYVTLSTFSPRVSLSARTRRRMMTVRAVWRREGVMETVVKLANMIRQPLFRRRLTEICLRTHADLLFASPLHHGHLFRAALSVSRKTGIPLAVYFLDDWAAAYKALFPVMIPWVECWQKAAMRTASAVYANGPGMQADYETRYGVKSTILANAVDLAAFSAAACRKRYDGISRRIIYTGTVYHAQKDALDNLVKALDLINRDSPCWQFELYSHLTTDDLVRFGWVRPYVKANPSVGSRAIPELLMGADALFLPLSFDPAQAYTARTSAPGKLAEYVASCRPIIIHAPHYADISSLSRQRKFGVLVDKPDPDMLVEALRRIQNEKYVQELEADSCRVAREYYDQAVVQDRLYRDLARIASGCGK